MEFLKNNQIQLSKYFDLLSNDLLLEPTIKEAMVYALEGGKCIRGSLLIETVKGLNSALLTDSVYKVAVSIEMIHAYSLIHDDLPALDNDDVRRGKPTVHKKYGEDVAILTGDALLTHAFTIITQTDFSAEIKIKLVELLSKAAGPYGMIYGQMMDLKYNIKNIDELNLLDNLKTGKMLTIPVEAAMVILKAKEEQYKDFVEFSKLVGISFQAKDDLLDFIGDEKKVGKKLNKDLSQNKKTYPYFLGIEGTQSKIDDFINNALIIIKKYNISNLEILCNFLKTREF